MRIGIYALARNEEKHVFDWAATTEGADVVVVTDTGSTDSTTQRLRAAGVTVATGSVTPWRWDDAHNLSLHHLPADIDIAVRLDLDERLQPVHAARAVAHDDDVELAGLRFKRKRLGDAVGAEREGCGITGNVDANAHRRASATSSFANSASILPCTSPSREMPLSS